MTKSRRVTQSEREEQEAEDYAAAILDGLRHDWSALNHDIIDRFSLSALIRIKRRAWRLVEERRA